MGQSIRLQEEYILLRQDPHALMRPGILTIDLLSPR